MKFRWSLAPPQPLLAGQLAAQLKIPPLARPMPAQSRIQRTVRHWKLSFAAPQASCRPVWFARHGRGGRTPVPRPRTKRAAGHLWGLRRGRGHLHRLVARGLAAAGLAGGFLSAQPHGRRLRAQRRRRGKLPQKISGKTAAGRGLRLDRRGNASRTCVHAAWTSSFWTIIRFRPRRPRRSRWSIRNFSRQLSPAPDRRDA